MSFEVDRRTGIKFKRVLKVGIMVGAIAGVLVMAIVLAITVAVKNSGHKKELGQLEKTIAQLEEEKKMHNVEIEAADIQLASEEDDWCLALVNENYPLDENYEPELAEFMEDYEIDARILEAAEQMFADAEEEGIGLVVRSAYRSYDTQFKFFNSDMQSWIDSGDTPLEAYNTTILSVALPGCSEHATGLAIDIVSESYQELDEEQEETEEAQWLMENCANYGFILRYPSDTTEITGITYEPWHYRYVGEEAAKEIMEQGITLEEYLGVAKRTTEE